MIELLPLISAFSLGILGGAHCLSMCGGIVGALTMAIDREDRGRLLALLCFYNLGRITSYCLLAVIFYYVFAAIEDYLALNFMRYIAAALLIAMGLYLAQWWQGLVYIEKVGSLLWRYIQPLGKSLLPVKKNGQALLLGMLWGWLPCGLIYSALAYAATAEYSLQAMLIMLSFALGTLPAVTLTGLVAERFLQVLRHKISRNVMAILMIAFGLWTLVNIHDHKHTEHQHSGSTHQHHH